MQGRSMAASQPPAVAERGSIPPRLLPERPREPQRLMTGPIAPLGDEGARDYLAPPRTDGRGPSGSVPACSQRRGSDELASPPLEISKAMVHLYKESFGRGPTKVRTTFAGPDTVVVVLEDAFTVTERTLLALGEIELLQNSRLAVQRALEER